MCLLKHLRFRQSDPDLGGVDAVSLARTGHRLGVFRTWVGMRMKPTKGWRWIVASGVITALAGFVIALGWPVNSLWILGLFLAADLIVQGSTMIAFSLGIRNRN